ncbi:MAG: AraC family transcriptional regulator [Bacteroidetes bacterium]|nr:MAG: AraC family transcriptional regulator [Bacteroidota bacterium]
MKHITIIVPDGQGNLSTLACIVGACEIFAEANFYWKKTGKKEFPKIELAGIPGKVKYYDGSIIVQPQVDISAITRTNLIIIPSSLIRTYEKAARGNQKIIEWIGERYKQGAEIATMCSGAFMLASSGLLNGRTCSTHWAHADTFRNLFPEVNLKEEKLITDEHGIYTNGGAYSFLNLMVYLVEKYYDRETAIYCSKVFQIEIDRQSQSAFAIFSTQKNHDDDVIKKAQVYIESNMTKKFSIEDLSSRFAIGRRHFDRRFVKATGNTPTEYSQRVKIESAKKAFESTRKNVNEVMYDVGYSDKKAFREVFRKITGMSPLEYRNKYNKEAEV